MAETYTCAACRETFDKDWTDEEAEAEFKRDFPGIKDTERDLVCDECYNRIMSKSFGPRSAN